MKNHFTISKFIYIAIITLSTNCLVNVSIRKIKVGKEFLPDAYNGLPYIVLKTTRLTTCACKHKNNQAQSKCRRRRNFVINNCIPV